MDNDILISIIVITYNSASTITETLESIRLQTYKNIELIITDDCSKDSTVEIAKQWIDQFGSGFQRVCIISSNSNLGIPANVNKGIRSSKGEWFKCIAGDDILLPNCIDIFCDYIASHPKAEWIFGKAKTYVDNFSPDSYDEVSTTSRYTQEYIDTFDLSPAQIARKIAKLHNITSPALFCRRSTYDFVGGYDERYTLCEDYPMHMKLLDLGIKIDFVNQYVVGYRRSSVSITSNSSASLFNYNYIKCEHQIERDYCYKYLSWRDILKREYRFSVQRLFYILRLNKNTKIVRLLYRAFIHLSL